MSRRRALSALGAAYLIAALGMIGLAVGTAIAHVTAALAP